jgi:hypothetical protein
VRRATSWSFTSLEKRWKRQDGDPTCLNADVEVHSQPKETNQAQKLSRLFFYGEKQQLFSRNSEMAPSTIQGSEKRAAKLSTWVSSAICCTEDFSAPRTRAGATLRLQLVSWKAPQMKDDYSSLKTNLELRG